MNTDFLHPQMSDAELLQVSSLGLAHIGDVVYEIMTRSYLVCNGTQTAKNLHAKTVSLVRASAQYNAAQKIIPFLTDDEQDVLNVLEILNCMEYQKPHLAVNILMPLL